MEKHSAVHFSRQGSWDRFESTGASSPKELTERELAWVATGTHDQTECAIAEGQHWLKFVTMEVGE